MATADKLTTVAENVPKVYHAGQLNVVENAECLKGSKSGTALLLDDISPVSHEMRVKIRGKNLIPYPYPTISSTINGITLTDNGDGTITANGTATANVTYSVFVPTKYFTLQKGKTYTVSDLNLPTDSNSTTYYLQFKYVDSDLTFTLLLGNKKYFTFTAEQEKIRFNIIIKAGVTVENLVFKPQIELGTTATDYTPYIPDLTAVKVIKLNGSDETVAEYTPTADGIVEGVTSLYPNTTLLTDTDGVIIDCDYYKDVDKAFDELTQAMTDNL